MLVNRPGRAASSPSQSALLMLLLPAGGGGGGRCGEPPAAEAHTPPAAPPRRRWRCALLQGSGPKRPGAKSPVGLLPPSGPAAGAQEAPGRRPQVLGASIAARLPRGPGHQLLDSTETLEWAG